MQVQSKVDVLVWHDLVQSSMKAGILGTYLGTAATAWIYLSTGTLRRLSWLAKGPVLAALYPIGMLLAHCSWRSVAASDAGRFRGLSSPSRAAAFLSVWSGLSARHAVASSGRLVGARFSGRSSCPCRWVLLRLVQVQGPQDLRLLPDARLRIYGQAAGRLSRTRSKRGCTNSATGSKRPCAKIIDEVLIVGHSSGAQMAVSIVADIVRLKRFRDTGPALSLLTLGQVIPMVSFLPDARRDRRDLRLLSTSEEITWLDVSAPGDGCSFALSDPVSVSGVAPEDRAAMALVISAAFTKTLSARDA